MRNYAKTELTTIKRRCKLAILAEDFATIVILAVTVLWLSGGIEGLFKSVATVASRLTAIL